MKNKQELRVWNTHTTNETLFEYLTRLIEANYHIDAITTTDTNADCIIIVISKR